MTDVPDSTTQEATGVSQTKDAAAPTGIYRYYVLIVLMTTYVFSYMDRYIMSILMEDIKKEFSFSDFQLGLLSGLAFAFLYSTLGIPIARLADRSHRIRIISAAVAIWSVFTAFCGLAANFWMLFLGRLGVGFGEAGGLAPAHSTLADYFKKDELSRALSVFSLGPSFGALAGLLIGGAVADAYGWRWAFVVVGLPGILLAALVYFTVKEPVRGALDPSHKPEATPDDLKTTLKKLWANRAYVYVNLGHALSIVTMYSIAIWLPTLFLRNTEFTRSEVGMVVGAITFLGGVPGTLLGGFIADYLAKRNQRWRAWIAMIAVLLAAPILAAAMLSTQTAMMIALFALGIFVFNISFVPGLAIVQIVVEPGARAMAAAFVFFLANFVGLGLGPVVVGAISDAFASTYGDMSINIALLFGLVFLVLAAWFFWLTARRLSPTMATEEPAAH